MVGKRHLKILILSAIAVLVGCDSGSGGSNSDSDTPTQQTRPFKMGFTPWPFDFTLDAVNVTYSLIHDNGDIVAQHLTQGIPWQEALTGQEYPPSVENEINGRVSRVLPEKELYLAIDALSVLRNELVGNWGANVLEPRPPPWDSRSFSDSEVITAYTNFALDMIERFDPDYFNYGTEANVLFLSNPEAFDQFVVFAREVYRNIKRIHPNLPVMISISARSPDSSDTRAFEQQFSRIADYVDIVGISAYPYAFFNAQDSASPRDLPSDWLSQIRAIAPGKPLAITETGWPAEDLQISRLGIDLASTEADQKAYVERLLEGAGAIDARFVIWFTVADFDKLWDIALGRDDLTLIWRDTGLYDENMRPREALTRWQEVLQLRWQAATE